MGSAMGSGMRVSGDMSTFRATADAAQYENTNYVDTI